MNYANLLIWRVDSYSVGFRVTRASNSRVVYRGTPYWPPTLLKIGPQVVAHTRICLFGGRSTGAKLRSATLWKSWRWKFYLPYPTYASTKRDGTPRHKYLATAGRSTCTVLL